MTKVTVRVGEKEMVYEFQEFWQIVWFVRIANFVVTLLLGKPK
jgi:hypothetical protein